MEEVTKAASKTHRERVKEFNEKLAGMSEHYGKAGSHPNLPSFVLRNNTRCYHPLT